MAANRGKQFEAKFKNDWLKLPNSTIDRLIDIQSGFKSISQISDFIGYVKPYIFYLECKSTLGNTFPLSRLKQYTKLLGKLGIPGANPGVVIWFIDHSVVAYAPIESIRYLVNNNYKSVNIKMVNNPEFKIYKVPSIKKQVFLDSDYSILLDIADERERNNI